MDFRSDADDKALVAAIAETLQRHFPIERLRRDVASIDGLRAVAADGWLHAGLAEQLGGQDMPLYQVCAFAREAGRVLCLDVWVNNAHLLPALIARIASADIRREWLTRHRERAGVLLVDGRRAHLGVADDDAMSADWCYGVEPGLDVYVVRGDDRRYLLARHSGPAAAFEPVGELAIGVGTLTVASGDRAEAALEATAADLERLVAEASLVHAAGLVGLAERAEAITVEYVKIREQFGQPVGKFQAVKHALADVRVLNEVAANSVSWGALRLGEDDSCVAVGRIQASEAALAAARAMIQLHGGIGFTWEADVHWFLKLALTGAARFGGAERHATSLGQRLVRV